MVVAQEDEIVISGIGGYFPKSNNVEELQKILLENTDGIDAARWNGAMDVCDRTGNCSEINHFDSSFFATHREQTKYLNPMARMILQNVLEAILDAGMSPTAFHGRRVLVAVASSISENDWLMFENIEKGFGVTGQARAMLANRISYWLHSIGPSYSCDASWLGGLQVLQHGYDAVRSGHCEAAIVCAANLTMNISPTYLFKHLGVTSRDGVTNTFGENAQGYARSDATCVFLLQRANQASRRYCTLVNVDSLFNGHRPGQFIKIDVDSARRFLQNFYQNCGVDPTHVNFIETYGSALKELDKIELNLIDDVFNNGNRKSPLLLGAVKTNIGHTEAADALISIVKTIIAMECGTIPASLHTENPRTDIRGLTDGKLKIVTENTHWNGTYAAVNSFGIASAFGHILLKRNTVEKIPQTIETPIKLPLLHILSTRSEDGIKDIIERIKNFHDNIDYTNLINGTFATHIPGYLYRGYVVKSPDNTFKDESSYYDGITKPVWFIYSGMGSQWLGMGKALLNLPIFARAVEKCANVLKPFDVDLMKIITSEDETFFDNIMNSFVGIAAIQIGLTDVLFSLGITPDGIIGHSVGELGCAYADGCVTAEQMILSAYYRGRSSLEAKLIPGLMAAVGVGATEVAKFVLEYPSIDIACHNGPGSCTLSGPKEDMEKMVKKLQDKGIFARAVNVAGIAYHSRYIKPAAPLLLKYLHSLITDPKRRSSKWLSSSVPEAKWQTDLAQTVSAEYLTNNLLSSVYFEEALAHIPKGSVLIEIAPHGLLQAILKRSVHQDSVNVALTRRGYENGLEFLFSAIGKLYLSGVQLDLSSLYDDVHPRSVIAPRGTPSIAPLVRWIHKEEWRSGLDEFKDNSGCEQIFSLDFHSVWFRDITNHRIHNSPVIPATAYLSLVQEIISNIEKVDAIEISNFSVQRNRLLGRNEYTPPISIMVQRGTGTFEVTDRYGAIAAGRATVPKTKGIKKMAKRMSEDNRNKKLLGEELFKLNGDEIYRELAMRGLELNGIYRAITDVRIYKNGLETTILWKNNFASFTTSIFHAHILHPSIPVDFLLPNYIRYMFVNFENIPEEDTPIPVRYIGPLDSIWSPIMLLENIKCSPTLKVARTTLGAIASRFIPEEMDEDIKVVVDACLQTARRELEDSAEFNVIVCNNNTSKLIRNILRQICQQNSIPRLQIHDINNFTDELPTVQLLVVSSLENVSQYLQNNPNTYILLCSDDNIQNTNLIQVLSSKYNDMHLLKLINNEKPEIFQINEPIINDDDTDNSALDWMQDLRTKLDNSHSRVYVACKYLPTNNDVDSFVKTIRLLKGGHKARFLFVLDENAPKVTPNESFYHRIFQQDVAVSVYVHGTWGSRYSTNIHITDKNFSEEEQQNYSPTVDIKINNIDVKYIGIHSSKVIPVEIKYSATPKLGLVDYCGIKQDTKTRVMGICNASLTPDSIFQWNLPALWSFVDGATAPASYALAYYALVELASLNGGETILIHNACTPLGQAMICVAFSLNAKILASVANEKQKALLLKYMKMLNSDTVIYFTNSNFEQKVMVITQGQGVDVLINCTKGERLKASARCIRSLGRAVLLHDEKDHNAPVNTETIGLSTFFRCVGMYGMLPARFCDLDEDKKRRVHQLVQQGLDNFVVTPIKRNIFRHEQSIENAVRYVTETQVTGCTILPVQQEIIQHSQPSVYQCDLNKPYVLYGLNSDIEHIILASIWLAKHNARKLILVISLKNNSEKLFVDRQLQYLNITVDITDKLPAINKLNNVAAIISLPNSQNISSNAIPPNTRLVHFLGINSPSSLFPNPFRSTLRCAKTSRFEDVLPFLNYALSQSVDLMSHGDDDNLTVEENFTFKDYFRLLEGSVPSLLSVKIGGVNSVTVEKVVSAGTGEIREMPPLFVVPGLLGISCRYLQKTIRSIMCPTYVINAQHRSQAIEDIAGTVVQRICEVCPKGPYNIAGVSTGGIVALEVAKLLDKIAGSNNVQLYLLDGIPGTLQYLINESQTFSHGLDSVLIEYLLKINQPEILMEILRNNKTWEARLTAALHFLNLTRSESQQMFQTINILRERLELTQKYSVGQELLNIPIKLLRPFVSTKDFSNTFFNICKQYKIKVFKGNHFTMLQSQAVADYINDNIITSPIYC